MNSDISSENVLRGIPLSNAYGSQFPHEDQIKKLEIYPLQLSLLQPASEMLRPWYVECDVLSKECNVHSKAPSEFKEWYDQKYMKNKPHGMIENIMLSPSKRS